MDYFGLFSSFLQYLFIFIKGLFTKPSNQWDFRKSAKEIAQFAVDYYEQPAKLAPNVTTLNAPGALYHEMERSAPAEPVPFEEVMAFFKKNVLADMSHWQHPRFHAFFPVGRSYPDMLAELLASAVSGVGFSWDSSPAFTEMEHVMVNWLGRAMGIPESHLFQEEIFTSPGGGTFFESSSEAIFCSILSARNIKLKQIGGDKYEALKKLVFYSSAEAHSSMKKGCKLSMVKYHSIETKLENEWGLTGAELEERIQEDIKSGLVPAFVIVAIGTTSNASSDHIESIVEVATKYGLYVHVDAAYAGAFWFEEKYRIPRQILEKVNSLSCSLHKMLRHSSQSSIFFCKDRNLHCDAFSITPAYLTPSHKETIDYRDWGIQLSRRFKALKTWFILSHYGIEGIKDHVNNTVNMATYYYSLVQTHPNCRLFGRRNFGVFCFQYIEPNLTEEEINEATTDLSQFMHSSHEIYLIHTKISGRNLIRISINYDRTTKETVDQNWAIIQRLIGQFQEKRSTGKMPLLRREKA